MDKFLIYLTFIPWILYFFVNATNTLKELKRAKKTGYWNWFKGNYYKILRLDTLLLIVIFFYFAKFDTAIVNKLLFSAINLYLWINTFYEKHKNKNKLTKEDASTFVILAIFVLIPFIWYEKSLTLLETYKLLFVYTFLTYIIVALARWISNHMKKLIKKRKKESK